MTGARCPFCGEEHTAGTPVCPNTNRRLQGLLTFGTIIDEKYRIDGIIGVGGMGVVYRAEHTKIGRPVALKVLLPEYIVYPELVARVEREARTAGQIEHPNVVAIVDLGSTTDQGPYIAMELLKGEELATTVERAGGKLDPGEASDIMRQALAGLDAAHRRGVIHRDLKPENIFLATNEEGERVVKVLDFGISKLRDQDQLTSLTRTGTVMGTPQFMAPEQAAGARDQDARIDIYAAGAVLYAVLTNGLPYEAENYNLLINEILNKPPIQILSRAPSLDPRLAAIVMKAIAKKADQRFQTARSMQEALLQWTENRQAKPSSSRILAPRPSAGLDSDTPPSIRRPASGVAARGEGRRAGQATHAALEAAPEALPEAEGEELQVDRDEATVVVPVPFRGDSGANPVLRGFPMSVADAVAFSDSALTPPTGARAALPVSPYGVPPSPPPPSPQQLPSGQPASNPRSDPPGAAGSSSVPPSVPPSVVISPAALMESPLDAPPIVLPPSPKPPPSDEAWAKLRTDKPDGALHAADHDGRPSKRAARWPLALLALVVLAALAAVGVRQFAPPVWNRAVARLRLASLKVPERRAEPPQHPPPPPETRPPSAETRAPSTTDASVVAPPDVQTAPRAAVPPDASDTGATATTETPDEADASPRPHRRRRHSR